MPVGKYKNFSICVAAQKRKGHDDESARKICGEIQKKSHEANSEEKTQNWVSGVLNKDKDDG